MLTLICGLQLHKLERIVCITLCQFKLIAIRISSKVGLGWAGLGWAGLVTNWPRLHNAGWVKFWDK